MTAPGPDVAQYARQVRAALADLPTGLSEELLEDLDEHLVDVAAGSARPLEDELGPASAYARELRAAAGLPEPPEAGSPLGTRLTAPARALRGLPATRAALAFLPELRPAWWVLRAWLVAWALAALVGAPGALPFGPLLGLPVLAALVVASVRLGRWTQRRPYADPREHLLALAGNAALALVALVVLAGVQHSGSSPVYAGSEAYGGSGSTLVRSDGSPITNIFPYSSDGRPLSGVLLYDQDGRALDDLSTSLPDGSTVERVVPTGPGSEAPPPANAYPQLQRRVLDGEPVTPAPPASPAPTPSPLPTDSPLATDGPPPTAPAPS